MDKARIAVTGARGLLGATLMRTLVDPVALSADIRDSRAVEEEFASLGNISHVVHTAAKTDVAACERDPADAHLVNAIGTKNIVDAAKTCGAHMLYISTVSVFSGDKGNYREADIPQPINIHNKTKVEGEHEVREYEKGIVLRLNLIGIHTDGSRGKNFMEWLVDSLRAGKDINAFHDVMINPFSNWTVADYIQKIITQEPRERILHIASSDVCSKADIAEIAAARFPEYKGTLRRTSVDTIADGVRRPKEMWLNCDYTKSILEVMMPSIAAEIDTIFRHIS